MLITVIGRVYKGQEAIDPPSKIDYLLATGGTTSFLLGKSSQESLRMALLQHCHLLRNHRSASPHIQPVSMDVPK